MELTIERSKKILRKRTQRYWYPRASVKSHYRQKVGVGETGYNCNTFVEKISISSSTANFPADVFQLQVRHFSYLRKKLTICLKNSKSYRRNSGRTFFVATVPHVGTFATKGGTVVTCNFPKERRQNRRAANIALLTKFWKNIGKLHSKKMRPPKSQQCWLNMVLLRK